MKNIKKILLCVAVLSLSLPVPAKRLRKMVKRDKCERYYRAAMRTTDLNQRMRYLKDAMAHAKSKDQKVKILVREAYTHHSLRSKELALMTIEKGLNLRSLNSRLKDKLMSAKISLSYWHGIKDEKLALAAQKLIYDRDYRNAYTLYFYIARQYIIKKQYQKAFDLYKTLERRAARDSRAYHMALIQQVSIAGQYLKQIQNVGTIIRKMKRSDAPSDLLSQFYYCAGRAYSTANNTKQAMKYFDKSIDTHSRYYTCLSFIEKGKLLKKLNKPDEALKHFTHAQGIAKHSHRHYLAAISIANIHRETNNHDEAMNALKKGLKGIDDKKYPYYEAKLLLKIASINVERKKYKSAARQFKKISENFKFSEGIRNHALKKFYLHSNTKIVKMLRIADGLLKSREYEAALKEAKSATDKSTPGSHFHYSAILKQIYILLRMQKPAEALSLFNSINLTSMSKSTLSRYFSYKVQIYTALDQPDDVIAAYNEYIPYNKGAKLSLANYLQKIKRPEQALEIYTKIFKDAKASSSQKISAMYKSIELLKNIGKYSEALSLIAKLCKIPECSKFHVASAKFLTAKILVKQGKYRKARRACSVAKRKFEAIIDSPKSSKSDIHRALDKWTECDVSSMDKSSTPTYKIKEGSFILETNLPNNENLKITYIVPVDSQGKPLPSAHNVVFHAPYAGEKNPLNSPHRRCFSEKLGFTSFSFNMKLDLSFRNDKQKFYIYNESGWHDIVFTAQQKLLNDFNLAPSKLLVVGQSSGGTMGQQLASAHPNKIDAVAATGGDSCTSVQSRSKVAWLVLNTWGDYYICDAKKLKMQAKSIGIQVLCGETPFILKNKDGTHAHHSASPFAWKLMHTFIRDVVALREKNNGVMPLAEKWPVEETINNEKQFLPSEKFASLWKKLPHESTSILANKADDSHIIVMPPSGRARAVILFVHDSSFYNSTHLMDNLYFLAKQNNIAIAVKVSDNHFKTLKKIKGVLKLILKKKKWRNLYVYVLGSGDGGRLVAAAALSNNNPRIKRITTFNSKYRWPFEKLSPVRYRRKSRILLRMLADNEEYLIKTKSRRTKPVLIKSSGKKFGKWWFYLLAQASKK
jgi:tetratricopeptide (TPR) repeat protein